MKSLFSQPLLHFFALGMGIFLLFQWTAGDQAADPRQILVDEDELREFIQYRSQNFDEANYQRTLARLTKTELDRIIQEFVREEALHREARALNLGRHDYVIRRRLVQKMEFIAEGFAADLGGLAEDELRHHYEENRGDYYVEPVITFAHVYFDQSRHGAEAARALALAKRDELNHQRAPHAAATSHGDRFLYHVNYVERPLDFVVSHFGAAMAEQLFELTVDEKRWLGPFASEHGWHTVLLVESRPGRFADYAEVAKQVAADVRRRLRRERTEAAIDAIIDHYDVRLELAGLRFGPNLQDASKAQSE